MKEIVDEQVGKGKSIWWSWEWEKYMLKLEKRKVYDEVGNGKSIWWNWKREKHMMKFGKGKVTDEVGMGKIYDEVRKEKVSQFTLTF